MTHGKNNYSVEYIEKVVKKDIPKLPKSTKLLIKKSIEEHLMVDPLGFGKPLRYSLKGYRRLRVNDYRVIYRIHSKDNRVIVVAIKHRKAVYKIRRLD